MGGVNNDRNYARTMGFGDYDDLKQGVNVTRPLLQGGIVCLPSYHGSGDTLLMSI